MAELVWGETGVRYYEHGLDRGVLYPLTGPGVVWSGLTAVSEKSYGSDITPVYKDGVRNKNLIASTDFQATISAFSAPDEFLACDGVTWLATGLFATQQPRALFGFSYRTLISNDLSDVGYKIHLVYNARATPSGKTYSTQSDSVDLTLFQWTIDTIPPRNTTRKPTAHICVDSTKYSSSVITALENVLYGTSGTDPTLPTQDEVSDILGGA